MCAESSKLMQAKDDPEIIQRCNEAIDLRRQLANSEMLEHLHQWELMNSFIH